MKLSIKLPLAFSLALLSLFVAGMLGITGLNQAVQRYEGEVLRHVAANELAASLGKDFSTAIQEWKNVLLRGKDPKEMAQYWAAHQRDMGQVLSKLKTLESMLTTEVEKATQRKIAQAIARTASAYEKAFEEFKAANFDPVIGDKAARGKDREASELLDTLTTQLSKDKTQVAATASALAQRASLQAYGLMLLLAGISVLGSFWLSQQIVRPLVDAVGLAQRVAQGDLRNHIDVTGNDELADLLTALKIMQDSLAKLLVQVHQGSQTVATASSEIAFGNSDLSNRTEQQASALQQTAAAMEELGATVKHNADSALQANQLAVNASTIAAKGGDVVTRVVETMRSIDESSRTIADIIQVIDGIAFQTNILALNAAVEAARAGEQGRGFAVVASEVRSLAGRSAEAAKQIRDLIKISVERVAQGSAFVDQAGLTMTEVVGSIKRVTDIMGEISSATTEQTTAVLQVSQAMAQMDQTTQQNAALVEQMAAAATNLKAQAATLVQTASIFKLS
jgi:methyl-accepting chemotaxis protein